MRGLVSSSDHAVVIGASLAGLAAAKVLSGYVSQVTILEREELPPRPDFRAGIPQGRHFHTLLRRGLDVFETLYPGFRADLVAAGAQEIVWGRDVRWYHFGGIKAVHDRSTFSSISASRLLYEHVARTRVAAVPNITIVSKATAREVLLDERKSRVRGIRFHSDQHGPTTIGCSFVVDASGRASRLPQWLADHGLGSPQEVTVDAFLGYTSRVYRGSGKTFPWKAVFHHPTPRNPRLGLMARIEDDLIIASLAGRQRDYPPADEQGFLEFAATLELAEFQQVIRECEPVGAIHSFRRTQNRRFRYESMPSLPQGLLAIGDSVCAFNPIYGQGMSTAAIAAQVLDRVLGERGPVPEATGTYFARLARALAVPWLLATLEDFRHPQTEGRRPVAADWIRRYIDKFIALTATDTDAYDTLLEVFHMTRSPTALARPALLSKTLRTPART